MTMRSDSYVHRLQRKNSKAQIEEFEIKEFQKHLRKKTFKIVLTSVLTIILVSSIPGLFKKYFAQSKGYQWIQTSWVGGSTSPVDTSTNLLTGWTKYFSKSNTNAITADATGVKLANVAATNVTETSGTFSGSGATTGSGMYATGNTMKLKKPQGAVCGSAGDNIGDGECAGIGSYCSGANTCCSNKCCGETSVAYNGDTYATVLLGTQCWFAENLRTSKDSLGNNIAAKCYTGDSNCTTPTGGNVDAYGAKYGALYTWTTMMNGASSVSVGPGPKGICPTGWHLPTDGGIQTLEMLQGMTAAQAADINDRGTNEGTKLKSGGSSGFNLPLAGHFSGAYIDRGPMYYYAYLWSATISSMIPYYRSMYKFTSTIYRAGANNVSIENSVRCLKD